MLVQGIGIVRELFVASQVGLSGQLDALLIAMALPMTLAGLLTAGIQTALVPAYLSARNTIGLDHARRLAGLVFVWTAIGGAAMTLVLVVLAGAFISIVGPGLSTIDHDSAIGYLYILSPLAFISSVSAILYAVCQAEERFRALAAAAVVGSVGTLVILLALWWTLGLTALAIATVAGPTLALLMLLGITLRASIAPRLVIRPRGSEIGPLLRHAAPLTLGSAILQINVIVDRAIASLIAPGAVSALRYAEVLIRTPIGAINPAWASAIYPPLVHMAQGTDPGGLGRMTDRMVRFSLATFIPISLLTIAVAPIAVSVAFGRGAFTAADLAITTAVAAAFAPLIVVLMTSPVIRLALNARRLGRALLIGATLNVILNTGLDAALGITLGVAGIALSSSITAALVAVYFARRLARSEETFRLRPIARSALLATVASAPAAIVIAAICWSGSYPDGPGIGLLLLAVFGTVGIAIYVALATRLGLEEPRSVVRLVIDRIGRQRGAQGSA